MSTFNAIKVGSREKIGTTAAHALRNSNLIPAIVYGANKASQTVSVCLRDVEKELRTKGILTRIFDLEDEGSKTNQKVLIKAIQFHPVTDKPIHIDFMRITEGRKVNVKIPLKFINNSKSPAIKQGGVLNIIDHMLEVSCGVDAVVSHIDVDLSGLDFHDTIKIKDISLPAMMKVLHYDDDHTVATIVAPSSVRSEVASQGADSEAEQAAATTAPAAEQPAAKS